MVNVFGIFKREKNQNREIAKTIKRDRRERERRAIKLREYDEKLHEPHKKGLEMEEVMREKAIELSKEDLERYYIFYNLTLNQISHLKIGLEGIILRNKKRESILLESEPKKIEIKISDKVDTEKCKCGKDMNLSREYEKDGFTYYEYICEDEDCEKMKTYSICNNCEHQTLWWDE